jgi:arginine decarboxylase
VGERAKFGLAIPDVLARVEALREAGLLADLRLLHFHIGSQINDIAVLKDALQEAGRIYPNGVPVPTLVSESGRAIASHF